MIQLMADSCCYGTINENRNQNGNGNGFTLHCCSFDGFLMNKTFLTFILNFITPTGSGAFNAKKSSKPSGMKENKREYFVIISFTYVNVKVVSVAVSIIDSFEYIVPVEPVFECNVWEGNHRVKMSYYTVQMTGRSDFVGDEKQNTCNQNSKHCLGKYISGATEHGARSNGVTLC